MQTLKTKPLLRSTDIPLSSKNLRQGLKEVLGKLKDMQEPWEAELFIKSHPFTALCRQWVTTVFYQWDSWNWPHRADAQVGALIAWWWCEHEVGDEHPLALLELPFEVLCWRRNEEYKEQMLDAVYREQELFDAIWEFSKYHADDEFLSGREKAFAYLNNVCKAGHAPLRAQWQKLNNKLEW